MGEQIIDNFSPDYVIPFKVPKNQVMDAFQKFSKKPLTPKDFNCDRVVDKMQGVYIPFGSIQETAKALLLRRV